MSKKAVKKSPNYEVNEKNIQKGTTYMDDHLTFYIKEMDNIQKKLFSLIISEKNFNMNSLSDMTLYVKLSAEISNFHAVSKGYSMFNKAVNFYFEYYYPISRKSSKVDIKNNCAKFGSIVAGVALIDGDYYLALRTLITLVEINPLDPWNYISLLKFCCFLKEWNIFEHYYFKKMIKTNSEVFKLLCDACHLSYKFHTCNNDEEKETILFEVEKLRDKIELLSVSYFTLFALEILYSIISTAGNLANFDLNKHMDSVQGTMNEFIKASHAIRSRIRFYDKDQPIYLYTFNKDLPEITVFFKNAVLISDFYESALKHVFNLRQCGLLHNCEQHLVSLLFGSFKIGSPFRMLQVLTDYYYLKNKTSVDKGKLKGFAACISLLLSRNLKLGANISHHQKLLSDNYIDKAASDTDSFMKKTNDDHGVTIVHHLKSCTCWLCMFTKSSGSFQTLKAWANYLLNSTTYNFDTFSEEIVDASTIISKRNLALQEILKENKEVEFFPQIQCYYFCLGALIHLMENKEKINNNVYKEVCNLVIQTSSIFLEYRGFYLLARQLLRSQKPKFSYSWLDSDFDNKIDQLTNSLKTLEIKKKLKKKADNRKISILFRDRASIVPDHDCQLLPPGVEYQKNPDMLKARSDFKAYNHLMYTDWRSRICLYLGSWIAESYPWYSAWYFIESQAIGIRQSVRIRKSEAMDMRFQNVTELKEFICNLPEDLSIIHLLLDEQNILWLIRIDCDSRPLVIPLKKLNLKNDLIIQGMEEILIANDQSVKNIKNGSEFWKERNKIDSKLKELIKNIESNWIGHFKPLLIPSGKFSPSLLEYLNTFCDKLIKAGYFDDHAKLLTRIYLHSSKEDFEWLLKVFAKLQANKDLLSNSKIQCELYQELMNIKLKDDVIKKYNNNEKYTSLIVSPIFASLPWEYLPLYEEAPYVLRCQSLNFLERSMKKFDFPHVVNPKNSYYLLNPGNDLPDTEKRMLANLDLSCIEGMKRNCPSRKEIAEILSSKDIFFYIGHGSGSNHFGTSTIREGQCRASAILMGCSSVRLTNEGRGYDGLCTAHHYAIAGSPCVVGCLWMVTDGEIDRFFIQFIKECFKELVKGKCDISDINNLSFRTLMKAMVKSRNACRLKHLTAAAVIAYGVPVLSALNDS